MEGTAMKNKFGSRGTSGAFRSNSGKFFSVGGVLNNTATTERALLDTRDVPESIRSSRDPNIYQYEKPSTFGGVVQFVGLAFMFGGMLVGDMVFDQLMLGFFIGFAAFIGIIAAYIRKTGVWHEDTQNST